MSTGNLIIFFVFCEMIEVFDISAFVEGLYNADELLHHIFVIESVKWGTVPIVNKL